jgi:hypothetical protein
MVNIDLLLAHPIQGFLGLTSAISLLLGVACEIIRTVQEITALQQSGQVVSIIGLTSAPDCSLSIAGTDIPWQPGATWSVPFWHILNALVMLVMAFSEWPATYWVLGMITAWIPFFKDGAGTWVTGIRPSCRRAFGLSYLLIQSRCGSGWRFWPFPPLCVCSLLECALYPCPVDG